MPQRNRRDPICGRELVTGPTTLSCTHRGETWFFCSRPCQEVFEAFPDQSVEIVRQEATRHCDVPSGETAGLKRHRR